MNLALIQNSAYKDYSECSAFALIVDLAKFKKSGDYIPEGEIEEFEWSLKELQTKELIDAVVISNKLFDEEGNIASESEFDRSAFALATHIRLTKGFLGFLPIIILSFKSFEDIVRESYRFPNILKTRGISVVDPHLLTREPVKTWYISSDEDFFNDEAEPTKHKLITIEEAFGAINKEAVEKDYRNILDVLQITSNKTSDNHHGIANEWGAYRLAQVAGIDMAAFNYPKTLYFKYLLAYQYEEDLIVSDCKPFWPKNLNVLYIDDNEHKGWSKCLKELLDSKIVSVGKATLITRKSWDNNLEVDIKDDKYDLVFLDYYLANDEKGDEILNEIKSHNPVLPVIMFTASNKVWNMDKFYEAGADGYYVKEHPQTAKDFTFSIENFKGFHKTIKKCLNKGKRLRPYWCKIREANSKSIIVNRPGEMIKERIDERLYMFLGLIKKSFEQTKFDETNFYYSDIELAFLTLWSLLNDVQQAYFDKIKISYKDKNGITHIEHDHSHLNPKPLFPERYNWVFKFPLGSTYRYTYYIKYIFDFIYDINDEIIVKANGMYDYNLEPKIPFKYDGYSKINEFYITTNTYQNTVKNIEQILHSHIAFILINMGSSNDLLTNLKILNDVRNKLYLTHGEENTPENYYSQLVQNRRGIDPNYLVNECKGLFEVVYFLTTGIQCIWSRY